MKTKTINTIILFAVLALHSCMVTSVSKNKLAALSSSSISSFSTANFNGNYKNQSDSCREKTANACGEQPPSLWKILYGCKSLFIDDSIKVGNNFMVNLNYDGKRKLIATLIDTGKTIKQIELKATVYKNNLAIKRKLLLIPIPIFFYVHDERRVLLANNSNQSLNVGYSKISEGQIIFGTSYNFLYNLYFPKQ